MKSIIASVAFCSATVAVGQNLVPNHSFEEYTICPQTLAEVSNAVGWSALYRSPDYYNACSSSWAADVPLNTAGRQEAYDGAAYMGLFTYIEQKPFSLREYIGIQLTQPLVPGVPVCLSYKMAMGGFGASPVNSANFTCDRVGLQFFNTWPTDWQDGYLYPDHAALYMEEVPMDTAIWYEVSGTYVPDSAYQLLAVGNFFSYDSLHIVLFDSTYGQTYGSYAFIDDIHVEYTEACGSSVIGSLNDDQTWHVWPVPFDDQLQVMAPAVMQIPIWLDILDLAGRTVYTSAMPQGAQSTSINASELPNGPYYLRARSARGIKHVQTVLHLSTP